MGIKFFDPYFLAQNGLQNEIYSRKMDAESLYKSLNRAFGV